MKSVYLGGHRALLETVDNCMMFVDTRDMLLAPNLLLRNEWEADQTAVFKKLLRPAMTFVDVGANIGYYTLLAARIMGAGCKILAFEPDPRNYELLRRNVIINAFQNVEAVQKAVYRRTERLRFHIRKNYGGNSSIAAVPQSALDYLYDETEEIEVESVSLDEYLPADMRIDVLKIDIEGAEPGAFVGMRETLARNRAIVVLSEWCPSQMRDAGNQVEELIGEWRTQEFVPYRIDRNLKRIALEELADIPYCGLLLKRG